MTKYQEAVTAIANAMLDTPPTWTQPAIDWDTDKPLDRNETLREWLANTHIAEIVPDIMRDAAQAALTAAIQVLREPDEDLIWQARCSIVDHVQCGSVNRDCVLRCWQAMLDAVGEK